MSDILTLAGSWPGLARDATLMATALRIATAMSEIIVATVVRVRPVRASSR